MPTEPPSPRVLRPLLGSGPHRALVDLKENQGSRLIGPSSKGCTQETALSSGQDHGTPRVGTCRSFHYSSLRQSVLAWELARGGTACSVLFRSGNGLNSAAWMRGRSWVLGAGTRRCSPTNPPITRFPRPFAGAQAAAVPAFPCREPRQRPLSTLSESEGTGSWLGRSGHDGSHSRAVGTAGTARGGRAVGARVFH
ncbi:hypothetical protein TREES_T100010382 [Tupaia chinensis]|uniref:Uncharacterized protein n=1 Tax=Tupaia chinensis TaxID=246437 RepID=L9LDB0_TUPCH|nr:hypothetical protein TREES_T100010382 [Tupaia chinensis]